MYMNLILLHRNFFAFIIRVQVSTCLLFTVYIFVINSDFRFADCILNIHTMSDENPLIPEEALVNVESFARYLLEKQFSLEIVDILKG